ncbi:MAG: type II secretion system protein [Bacilli bacterium]|nr:type II secretion system protein [Bacilli bacterium]
MKLKNKNKKGFTLVELLAVIVILSVVALIGMTTVLPRVEQARKDAFVTEANKFMQAGANAYATLLIDGGTITGTSPVGGSLGTGGGTIDIRTLVSKGYINKADIAGYSGCVQVTISGSGNSAVASYQIKLSNGKFNTDGYKTNVTSSGLKSGDKASSC